MEGGVVNLEGNISAGKSTMSDSLADLCKQNGYNVVVLKETINKAALEHFNENPKENGLVFQKTMMNLRLSRMKQARQLLATMTGRKRLVILDTGPWREFAFTDANMAAGTL